MKTVMCWVNSPSGRAVAAHDIVQFTSVADAAEEIPEADK